MVAALVHGDAALDEADPEEFLRVQKTFEVVSLPSTQLSRVPQMAVNASRI